MAGPYRARGTLRAHSCLHLLHTACYQCRSSPLASQLHGQRFSVMCRSKSSRKYFSALCNGSAAPGKRTKRIAWRPEVRLVREVVQKLGFSVACFESVEHLRRPRQAAPAGRAPTARFLSEEVRQVSDHPDRTILIVEHDHRSGPHTASGFLHFGEIHTNIEMLLGKKIRGRTARKEAAEFHAVAHAARVLFQKLANRCAHGQLP